MSTPGDVTKRPLPDGWRWVRLGEVCEFVRGVSFDKAEARLSPDNGFIPILRAGNIQDALMLERDLVWVPAKNVSEEQILQVGDIAICMSSGSTDVVGKTAQLLHHWYGSVGAFCGIIRPQKTIVPEWIGHWFRSSHFTEWRDGQARGANIQNLRFSQIQEIEIPLPPLSEQQRIAAILREQMAAVERARRAAEEQLEAAKALPAAFLRRVFPRAGQPLPDGWRWVRLGEVCEIVMGQSPEGSSYNTYGVGEPLLNGPTEFGQVYPTAIQWTTSPTRFCNPGDILICVRGATTGRKNRADQRYCIGRGLAAVRGNACADNDFVWFALDLATDAILREAAGSTFPNIPGDKLETIEIPLPPLSEQQRIAAILREQMAAVERARQALEAQLEAIHKLPAAILRKAFNGAL